LWVIIAKRYHYIRYSWWKKIDIETLSSELSEMFHVEAILDHGWDLELTIMKDARDRYLIKSDTLTVFLSVYRVNMLQKKAAPFTARDLELRERLLELFPKERPTILPWQLSREPEFEVIEELKEA